MDFVHHNCFSLYILLVERWEIIDILGCLKKLRWGHVSGRACPPFFGGRFWPRALRSEERGHVWHFCMFFRPFWAFYKLGSRSTLHFAVKSKVCELKARTEFCLLEIDLHCVLTKKKLRENWLPVRKTTFGSGTHDLVIKLVKSLQLIIFLSRIFWMAFSSIFARKRA